MAATNMHNLTTLIKRLEAATSRLEDMAHVPEDAGAVTGPATSAKGTPRAVSTAGAVASPPTAKATPPEDLPASVEDYDDIMNTDVKKYAQLSEGLGDLVGQQAASVIKSFEAQRKVLIIATKVKKPDPTSPEYLAILRDLQHEMGAVGDIREANRPSPLFNHLCTVAEGIQALAWITIEPKPASYLEDTIPSAQFYGNRVLKSYKEKDQKHVEWVQSFYQIFRSLTEYVKKHFTTGFVWNNKSGISAKDYLAQSGSAQSTSTSPAASKKSFGPSASGGPPPPPPPMPTWDPSTGPPAPPPPPSGKSAAKSGDMGAVFDQLNQGSSVTSGLRKVDRSEMTHKNPSLRAGSSVPTRSDSASSTTSRGKSPAPPGTKPRKPDSMRTKKPPRKELDGNKWIVENYDGEAGVIEIEASINQSILVSRCAKTTIRVQGKANAISIDNCTRLSLIVDSLVSSVDVVKAGNFALQVLGALPTILLDQVDGATIYLAKTSLGTEVFSSKSTGLNVNLPPEVEDDDFREEPLPEQIRSFVKGGRLVSEIVEHAG